MHCFLAIKIHGEKYTAFKLLYSQLSSSSATNICQSHLKVLIKQGIHKYTMHHTDPYGQGGVGLIPTSCFAIYSYVHMGNLSYPEKLMHNTILEKKHNNVFYIILII